MNMDDTKVALRISAPNRFDEFMALMDVEESNVDEQLRVAEDLIRFMESTEVAIGLDMVLFIEKVLIWMKSTNPLVAVKGIHVVKLLIYRIKDGGFKKYLPMVLPVVIYRLGDNDELVRKQCRFFIASLFGAKVMTADEMFLRFERSNIIKKNSYARKAYLNTMISAIRQFGLLEFNVKPLIPVVVNLLSDDNTEVQKAAGLTLATFYTYIGEKLKADIQKLFKGNNKLLIPLFRRFDYIRREQLFVPPRDQEKTAQKYYKLLDQELPHVEKTDPAVEMSYTEIIDESSSEETNAPHFSFFEKVQHNFETESERNAYIKDRLLAQDGEIKYLNILMKKVIQRVKEIQEEQEGKIDDDLISFQSNEEEDDASMY